MNMIFHAADNDGLAIVMGQDAAKITMQFFAQSFVAQKWATVFGGKNRMHKNLGERLRHGGDDAQDRRLIQPFQG
jgi:hypothetical protein